MKQVNNLRGGFTHYIGHTRFQWLYRLLCEIELFFPRAGFYTKGEWDALGFSWERIMGRPGGVPRDGYRKYWGARLSPRRIYHALEFAWYTRDARFIPCDGSNDNCPWSHA